MKFLRSITGIKWAIIVSKKAGEMVARVKVVDEERGKAIALIYKRIYDQLEKLGNLLTSTRKIPIAKSSCVRLNSEILQSEEYAGYIYVFQADPRLYYPVSKVFDILRSGKQVSCSSCGKDLTLAVYRCPNCGRTVPFITPKCPYCGHDMRVKKCPYCGVFVDSLSGRKAYRNLAVLISSIAICFVVALTSIYAGFFGGAVYPEVTLIGILLGLVILYIGLRSYSRFY